MRVPRSLLPLLAFAAGCGAPEPAGDGGREEPTVHAEAPAATRPEAPAARRQHPAATRPHTEAGMPRAPADSLRLALELPDSVRAGAAVPIALRVTNAGEEPVRLELRGRPIAFDIVVESSDGSVVWRRLEGRMVTAILQLMTLGPGETLELREEWDQRAGDGTPVDPGAYTVRGRLPAVSPGPLEAPPVALRILPQRG